MDAARISRHGPRDRLAEQLVATALSSPDFAAALDHAAEEIRQNVHADDSEATVAGVFERVLYAELRTIGITFNPRKEVAVKTRRHVGKGRIDSRLGNLVFEYKSPRNLRTATKQEEAIKQLTDYLASVTEDGSAAVGLVTDGTRIFELHASDGAVHRPPPSEAVSGRSLARIVRHVQNLALTALTADNLIRDLCGTDGALFAAARHLREALRRGSAPRTAMLFAEWQSLYRLGHSDSSQQRRIEERRAALAEIFGDDLDTAAEEYEALFCLHTAYAIVLKLMAVRVLSEVALERQFTSWSAQLGMDAKALRAFCASLENGSLFRSIGILNLLEGDFFAWYCDPEQWNRTVAKAVAEVIEVLSRYEATQTVFGHESALDLFRRIFEETVPRVVRASFGEFHTPAWLAEDVLSSATEDPGARIIDPCAGSGTLLVVAIDRFRDSAVGLSDQEVLDHVLDRVVGIDLNPLSVLTARINYFIRIADLLPEAGDPVVIPVFLGDASNVPKTVDIDGIACVEYTFSTLKAPIRVVLPRSFISDTRSFVVTMHSLEQEIREADKNAAEAALQAGIPATDRSPALDQAISLFVEQLIGLHSAGWDGIWARIVTNYLSTAALEPFDAVVGNPPWIDWKNLPQQHREEIKELAIERHLFSGDGQTGGINLNICALITHVSITNWLKSDGTLAFLMPRELAVQQSYQGWRDLKGAKGMRFEEFRDWSKAGHPFDPVKEDFMTYVIGPGRRRKGVPVAHFTKQRGGAKAAAWANRTQAMNDLDLSERVAGQIVPGSTAFTFADSRSELRRFSASAGTAPYKGREGIEFYPQELLIFRYQRPGPGDGLVWVRNIQVRKSKYRIAEQDILLESKFLHPLVKGREITPFRHQRDDLLVPFPYDAATPRKPLARAALRKQSPRLLDFFDEWAEIIKAQTKFSDAIRGSDPGEFYGLARTGAYSFAECHVAFRDNSKWAACVITSEEVPWGGRKRVQFQNHAVSICERPDGEFIDEQEAHYICAVLNAPTVVAFLLASSDNRSFKIRPPVFLPVFDAGNADHQRLSDLSVEAHAKTGDLTEILDEIDSVYLGLERD